MRGKRERRKEKWREGRKEGGKKGGGKEGNLIHVYQVITEVSAEPERVFVFITG